ncbi:hypothetical protein G7046_g1181 [Stylonectria norvegica]|nr:hypothetical protein G7046_g1181 [Stylonectria norvegica]
MSGRYERVNAHDDDDAHSPSEALGPELVPNSPPPSFHSRSSSPTRQSRVDPDLADAFDSDDDSDDETDDRQRLVRQTSTPLTSSTESVSAAQPPAQPPVLPSIIASGSRPRVMGGGGDGVFANLSARPERAADPEKEEMPPSYEQAAADAAPPYWETTILAPGMGGPDEVYVDGMPVGSFFSFVWNCMISVSFQLVGFLLTYLLHSTHAAKNGSRAGLGITLIQWGFYMKGGGPDEPPEMNGPDGYAAPPDPNSHEFKQSDVTDSGGVTDITGSEWLSYVLMVVGWFILIKSVAEFLRARRHEQLVLQSPDRGLGVAIIAEGENSEHVRGLNMAWRSSGDTIEALIENMWKNGLITDPRVKEAFLKVDRAHYAPVKPYKDYPQPIGHSATISAPHMHASAVEHMLSYLIPSSAAPAPRVLDVGSGSGYLTHVMAELVGDKGLVVGLEHITELKQLGETNMAKSEQGRKFLDSGRVLFRVGDGREGWVEAPREGEESEGKGWDVIHVGAAAKEIHPQLLGQIKSPGCMFIPVDDDDDGYNQHVWRVEKDGNGEVTKKRLFGVRDREISTFEIVPSAVSMAFIISAILHFLRSITCYHRHSAVAEQPAVVEQPAVPSYHPDRITRQSMAEIDGRIASSYTLRDNKVYVFTADMPQPIPRSPETIARYAEKIHAQECERRLATKAHLDRIRGTVNDWRGAPFAAKTKPR